MGENLRPESGPMVVRQVGELCDCKRVVIEPWCDRVLGDWVIGESRLKGD